MQRKSATRLAIATLVSSAAITGFVAMPAFSQTTIIQSNTGIGCSSVCINGKCTSSCNGEVTESSDSHVGNGDIQEKKLDLKDFESIAVTGVNTMIRQGEVFEVKVVADSNLLDKISVKKDGTRLNAQLKNGEYRNATLSLEVVMPELMRIEQLGSETLTFSGFDQSAMEVRITGASDITGNNNIVSSLKLEMMGSGTIDLMGTELAEADLTMDGAGDVRLNFSESTKSGKASITGTIAGVGEVQICGDPDNSLEVFGVADFVQVECPGT